MQLERELSGEWDPARLEQALSNLISNAVDHGDPDARVVVALRGVDASVVHVEVVNRGEMPPSVLDHAFEPFQRPSEREARRSSGLGLGLYIAREIVLRHGGDISVRSADGETLVCVVLPRPAPVDADAPRA